MPRYDTYLNQLQTIKPDYYCQTNHGTVLIWGHPHLNKQNNPFISAYFNGENPPIRFCSHPLNEQKGRFLFRKGRCRIYPEDLRAFPLKEWPGNLTCFTKPFPKFLIPYY